MIFQQVKRKELVQGEVYLDVPNAKATKLLYTGENSFIHISGTPHYGTGKVSFRSLKKIKFYQIKVEFTNN